MYCGDASLGTPCLYAVFSVFGGGAIIVEGQSSRGISHGLVSERTLHILCHLSSSKCGTCLINNNIHSVLLKHRPGSFSITASTRPHRVGHLFGEYFLIKHHFHLTRIIFNHAIVRATAFHGRPPPNISTKGNSLCRASSGAFNAPRRSTGEHSFAIGNVFCSVGSFSLVSCINNLGSLRGHVLHSVNSPGAHFYRSPIHVVETIELSYGLKLSVRGTSCGTVIHRTGRVRGTSVPHILRRVFHLFACNTSSRSFGLV